MCSNNKMIKQTKQNFNNKKLLIEISIFILILISAYFIYSFDFFSLYNSEKYVEIINSYGVLAPLFYILLMALAIIISPIPSLPLAAISGIVFGSFLGTLYSVIGATIGAVIAFLIARVLGRNYIITKFGKNNFFLEKYSQNNLMAIIFIMRLFPFFQFDIISYGSGITKIKLWKFTLATVFGMIPMTYLFVKSGDLIFSNNILGFLFMIIIIVIMYLVPKYYKFQ